MKSLAAIGPVISVSCSSGGVEKVRPGPRASYSTFPAGATGSRLRAMRAGSR